MSKHVSGIQPSSQSFVRFCVVLLLALSVLSHHPLMPFIKISPFQAFGVAVAVFGLVSALFWFINNGTTRIQGALYAPVLCIVGFLGWILLSFIWGQRSAHELYYIGLVGVGFFFSVGVYKLLIFSKFTFQKIVTIIILVGVVLAMVGIWQFIGESLGIQRSATGICSTCNQASIGFARPSGFSQEPEHFSTLLIGPLVVLLAVLVQLKGKIKWLLWAGLVVIIVSLCLAASRSGLLAMVASTGVFVLYALWNRRRRFVINITVTFIFAAICSLYIVSWSGSVNGRSDSSYPVERYIAHTSGGLVILGSEQDRMRDVEQSIKYQESEKKDTFNYITDSKDLGPSGAVVYSTQSRLETYKMAVAIWVNGVKNFVLGVGWGNFGASAHAAKPNVFSQSTIVNNQYLQIVVELGIVGLAFFLAAIGVSGRYICKLKINNTFRLAIVTLIFAYGIQLLFYSSLHLLQFWLSAAVIAYLIRLQVSSRLTKSNIKAKGA